MVNIRRKEHFNAAHKLYRPDWSAEKNREVFGACANENWHGHNFDLIVEVQGEPDPLTGFVMDFKDLKAIIHEHVLEELDHKNLNLDVPWLKGKMPTTEVLIMEIWKRLEGPIKEKAPAAKLAKLTLFETHQNSVVYYGP